MALTVEQLLLTPDRQGQLTAALANAGLATPLETLITEAEAVVASDTGAFTLPTSVSDAWARILALRNAFVAAEIEVPKDLAEMYGVVQERLRDIRLGRDRTLAEANPPTNRWGSQTQINTRAATA